MFNYKEIKDFFLMSPEAGRSGGPSCDPEVRQMAHSGKKLKVTIACSHAGKVNRNHVMYTPQGIQNSAHTWTVPLRKPVQIHHDDHADPIGRIISGRYSPFEFNRADNSDAVVCGSFLSDATTKDDVIDAANALQDAGVLDDPNWKGVGSNEIVSWITDADAIEKILDQRYLGGSVTQRPLQAFCSICKQDWINDSECKHQRGEVDEETGKRMFLIVGDATYEEYSFVNRPADLDAQPIEAVFADEVGGIHFEHQESVKVTYEFVDSIFGESTGPTIQLQDEEQIPEPQAEVPIQESVNQLEENEVITVDNALKTLFEDEDSLTGEMVDVINDAIEDLIEEQDAKLTAAKRNKLKSSTFCGPARSFPVDTCGRFSAALRFLSRYKGPGDKSRIESCIKNKGKKMGCTGDADNTTDICLDCLSQEELLAKHTQIEELLVAKGITIPRESCQDCVDKESKLSEAVQKVTDSETTLKVLREELQLSVLDSAAAKQALVDNSKEIETLLSSLVRLKRVFSDKDTAVETIDSQIKELSIQQMRDEISSMDVSPAISFFRSGLTQEVLEEQAIEHSDAAPVETQTIDPTTELKEIALRVKEYKENFGMDFAQSYVTKMYNIGKLPEMGIAKLLELVAE